MNEVKTPQTHPILDKTSKSLSGAISLYTMKDGSHRIGGHGEFYGEHNGSIGFPWGEPYRETMNRVIRSLEDNAKHWLKFFSKYAQGERIDASNWANRRGSVCTSFVANGEAYTAYHGTDHKGHFLGFGGDLVTVTMHDGKVIESNNLWHAGAVPQYMREVLKDNATLVWGRAKATGGAS